MITGIKLVQSSVKPKKFKLHEFLDFNYSKPTNPLFNMFIKKVFGFSQLVQILALVWSHTVLDGECPQFSAVENLNWKKVICNPLRI